MKKAIAASVLTVACVAGYVCADAADVTPGYFTLKPIENAAREYPALEELGDADASISASNPEQAPVPDAQSVQGALDNMSRDERFAEATLSAVVLDAVTGRELGALNASTPLAPASTMKILTAYAALAQLGPEATFTTSVMFNGTDLYLVGGGDIMLGAGESDPTATVGRAGLATLARQVVDRLAESGAAPTRVYVDTSLYTGPAFEPSLDEDSASYVMASSPIAVNRAQISEFDFKPDPAGDALGQFVAQLGAAGLAVESAGHAAAPDDAIKVADIHSAPLRDIVDLTLLVSDNSLAENLARQVAHAIGEETSFEGGSRAVLSVLKDAGINLEGAELADASGLSENNRLTATTLIDVLQHVWECGENSGCAVTQIGHGMPLSSFDGTLSQRYVGSTAAGRVRAKTGSLSITSSLAGFAYTEQGRPLIIAVIAMDAQNQGAYAFRPAIDDAVAAIVKL